MAKAFSFSLQKVLDIRKHREDQKAIELSRKKAALNKEKEKLKQLRSQKNKALDDESTKENSDLNLNTLIVMKEYIEELNSRIKHQNQRVEDKGEQVRKSHKKLVEAMKKKKIVEILKDRKYEEFKKTTNLNETKMIDEIAVRKANRSMNEDNA